MITTSINTEPQNSTKWRYITKEIMKEKLTYNLKKIKSSSYLLERQQNLAFHVLGILEYTSFPFLILQLTIKFRFLNNHNDNKDNLCKLTCVYDQMRISLIQGP